MRAFLGVIVLASLLLPVVVLAVNVVRRGLVPLEGERDWQRRWIAEEWDEFEPALREDGWTAEKIAELKANVFGRRSGA